MKMRISGTPPVMAIYTDGDDAPFHNPETNASRLKFHSAQPYIGASGPYTGSVAGSDVRGGHALFAHGLSYAPLCIGQITYLGEVLPINSTIWLRDTTLLTTGDYSGIDISIVSTQSHVCIAVNGSLSLNPSWAIGFSYEIWTTNYGVTPSGVFRTAPAFSGVRITPTRTQAGEFDTDQRYIQRDDAAGTIRIALGPTVSVGIGRGNSSSGVYKDTVALEMRYAVGSYVHHIGAQRNAFGSYPAANDSFVASVTRATT